MSLYIISQILVFLGYICTVIAFRQEKQDDSMRIMLVVLLLFFGYYLLNSIQYGFQAGAVGMVSTTISAVRNIVFILNIRKNKRPNIKTLIAFIIVILGANICVYNSIRDLCPAVMTLIVLVGYWSQIRKYYDGVNVCASLCTICYVFFINGWIIIAGESISIIVILFERFKVRKHSMKNITKTSIKKQGLI